MMEQNNLGLFKMTQAGWHLAQYSLQQCDMLWAALHNFLKITNGPLLQMAVGGYYRSTEVISTVG